MVRHATALPQKACAKKFMICASLTVTMASLAACVVEDTVEDLGVESTERSIVGGHDAAPTPYFTMTLRQSSTGSYSAAGCGASLISSCYALTAAHCVTGSRVGYTDAVYINAYQPYAGNPGVPYFFTGVSEVIAHEGYVSSNNKDDVALLKLEQCIPDGQFKPVRLAPPDLNLVSGQMLEVYGFGRLGEDNSTRVDTLQEVSVPFIEKQKCRDMYASMGLGVVDDAICAGYEKGGKDSCQGDSGGPIVDNSQDPPVQVGVVSWGVGCARPGAPGVYSSVSAHIDWITQHVCADARENQHSDSLCNKQQDNCPDDPNKSEPGLCGCGVSDADRDHDNAPDCTDQCPDDPTKVDPGQCGCGTADGTCECVDQYNTCASWAASGMCTTYANFMSKNCCATCRGGGGDLCPSDPEKTEPGICGCGIADSDSDHDQTVDCNDGCPQDSDKIKPGECGCGVPEGSCSGSNPNSDPEGYRLSSSKDFSTNDTHFSSAGTLYLQVWDSSINQSQMKKAEYELSVGGTRKKGSLANASDGTFVASIKLNGVPQGAGTLKVKLEDKKKNKYQTTISITVN